MISLLFFVPMMFYTSPPPYWPFFYGIILFLVILSWGEAVSRGDRKSESNLTITLLIAFSPGLMRLGLTLCIPLLIGLILSKTPERGIWGFIAGLFTFGLGIFQFTNSPLYSRLRIPDITSSTFLGIDFSICRIID